MKAPAWDECGAVATHIYRPAMLYYCECHAAAFGGLITLHELGRLTGGNGRDVQRRDDEP